MRNNLRIHLLTAAFAAFSCTATAEVPGPAAAQEVLADTEGAQYIEVLIRAIDAADQIVVIEHSDYYDAYGSDTGWLVLDQQILYAKKDLNKEQIAAFRSGISALNPTTQNMFSSCTFESHHTITFFRSGEPQSVMRICFKCAEVEWSATSLTPPWSLYGGLGAFVSSMGMQPDRDWRALAMERIK